MARTKFFSLLLLTFSKQAEDKKTHKKAGLFGELRISSTRYRWGYIRVVFTKCSTNKQKKNLRQQWEVYTAGKSGRESRDKAWNKETNKEKNKETTKHGQKKQLR